MVLWRLDSYFYCSAKNKNESQVQWINRKLLSWSLVNLPFIPRIDLHHEKDRHKICTFSLSGIAVTLLYVRKSVEVQMFLKYIKSPFLFSSLLLLIWILNFLWFTWKLAFLQIISISSPAISACVSFLNH